MKFYIYIYIKENKRQEREQQNRNGPLSTAASTLIGCMRKTALDYQSLPNRTKCCYYKIHRINYESCPLHNTQEGKSKTHYWSPSHVLVCIDICLALAKSITKRLAKYVETCTPLDCNKLHPLGCNFVTENCMFRWRFILSLICQIIPLRDQLHPKRCTVQ